MIQTDTGYKIVLNSNSASNAVEGVKAVNDFFASVGEEGVWYAFTGKHFGEWFLDICISLLQFIVDISDVLIILGMIFLLLVMFGSQKSGRWLYWTVCAYVIFQTVGLIL